MVGELRLIDELNEYDSTCDIVPSYYDFGFSLYIDEKNNLWECLENKKEIKECIDRNITYYKKNIKEHTSDYFLYNYLIQNINLMMHDIEYIGLFFNKTDPLKYIKDNPILAGKKIVLNVVLTIKDYDKANELSKKYSNYLDSIYVCMENNIGYVKLIDCLKTLKIIKDQADEIEKLNLSPIETIMYTYDLVRNRVYKKENTTDSTLESRNLNSVLAGQKIVCAGFSNIFDALLSHMGFRTEKVILSSIDNNADSHQRNAIYIKDDKYNIDGVYYFDATWDSKKENETNEFLNRYCFFCKTRKEMIDLENNNFVYNYNEYYSDNMSDILKTKLKNTDDFLALSKKIISINHMARLIDGKNIVELSQVLSGNKKINIDEISSQIRKVEEKYNKPLFAETLIELLNNVRKIQNENNPSFYEYSLKNIYETYIISNWKFNNPKHSDYYKIMLALFDTDERILRYKKRDEFNCFVYDNNIVEEIKKWNKQKKLKI